MKIQRKSKVKMTYGGRNLVILGVVSIIVATTTTGVSLAIYHNSGDIYLDRSRPGYLPDEEETMTEPVEEDYNIEKSGAVTKSVICEYLEAYERELEAVDAYKDPFGMSALSDEKLGITE